MLPLTLCGPAAAVQMLTIQSTTGMTAREKEAAFVGVIARMGQTAHELRLSRRWSKAGRRYLRRLERTFRQLSARGKP